MKLERRHLNFLLAAAIVVGVLLRVVIGAVHPFWFPDSTDYDALARAILHGGNYAVATTVLGGGVMRASRMPGYPVFLAGIYAIFGAHAAAVAVVQGVLSVGIIGLAYVIGRRAGEGVGVLAAWLVAVDPLSVGFSATVLTEMPFTLLMMVGVWLCVRLLEMGDGGGGGGTWVSTSGRWGHGWAWWGRWALLGVVWGGGVYFRAEALWALVPLGVVVWCWNRRWRSFWGTLLAIVVMFGVLSPWLIRNGHGPFRMTSLEGISLYEAVYGGATGGPRQDVIALPAEMRGMGEWARDAAWGRRARAEIVAHPWRVVKLAGVKLGRTWSPWLSAAEARGMGGGWVEQVIAGWYVGLFILGIIGVIWGWRGGTALKIKVLMLVLVVYFTALHGIFLGSARYRVPLMPLACLFAAGGVIWAMPRNRVKRGPTRRVGGGLERTG